MHHLTDAASMATEKADDAEALAEAAQAALDALSPMHRCGDSCCRGCSFSSRNNLIYAAAAESAAASAFCSHSEVADIANQEAEVAEAAVDAAKTALAEIEDSGTPEEIA